MLSLSLSLIAYCKTEKKMYTCIEHIRAHTHMQEKGKLTFVNIIYGKVVLEVPNGSNFTLAHCCKNK